MYIITQSCVLFLWLHSLTFVKSEDCTLANFINGNRYDRNFDTSGLESSYPPGKQVRVGCNVGYTGFFRLVCLEDGKWSYKGTNCQRKSCGHPGDAQFADFELVGDDFVFGSQVVYTCHKGYQMVSRKNILHCMENGWDGVIPVCEAQHCPVITVNNNVQVIGDPEEATYGNVLRFGCRSSNEALIGSQEIYCNERGQWSEEVPTCGEVRCSPPVIENGYVVGDIQVYKQHEFLEYKCNRHYKPTEERLPTCTKIGIRAEWSPTPACEQVTCKLSLPATEGTSYDPPYRNVFSPGETLRVICGEKYWISRPQDTSAEITCRNNGKWSLTPTCNKLICLNPRDRYLRDWDTYWGQQITLGDTVRYSCKSGFKRTDGVTKATCTREGWKPDPFCQAITCLRHDIQNANIVRIKDEYRFGEQVNYVCKDGYEGSFALTCREDGWAGNSYCREVRCDRKHYSNAEIIGRAKSSYKYNEQVEYLCQNGYEGRFSITCGQNGWIGSPQCREVTCEEIHYPDAEIIGKTKSSYKFNEQVEYACKEGYDGRFSITCGQNGWTGSPQCREVTCPQKRYQNAETIGGAKSSYKYNEQVEYVCKDGFEGRFSITCGQNGWIGSQECREVTCPQKRYQNAETIGGAKSSYKYNEQVEYVCKDGFEGRFSITCGQNGWIGSQECREVTCDEIYYSEAEIIGKAKTSYKYNEQVEYLCQNGYEGRFSITCGQDGWTGSPQCREVTCPQKRYQNAETIGGAKSSYKYNEQVEYVCKDGFEGRFSITCGQNGWIGSQECREVTCDEIYYSEAEIIGKAKTSYKYNEQVEYLCQNGYEGRFSITCGQDGWTGSPQCREVTCPQKRYQNAETIGGAKSSYKYNEQVEYVCKDGFEGRFSITCGQNGWIGSQECREESSCGKLPVIPNMKVTSGRDDYEKGASVQIICEEGYTAQIETLTCLEGKWNYDAESLKDICAPNVRPCSPPPKVENAIVETSPQKEYASGSDVTYRCRDHYTIKGDATITCDNGSWEEVTTACTQAGNPCGPPPDVENADIVTSARDEYSSGSEVTYSCRDNYTGRGQATITCTNGRWRWRGFSCSRTPCAKPNVPHGFIVGPYNETLYYTCEEGYKLVSKGWWGEATCNDGIWSGLEQCIEKSKCGELPLIPHRKLASERNNYRQGERVPIICEEGYIAQIDHITCRKGKWQLNGTPLKTICASIASHCSAPPKVENAVVVTSPQREYLSGSEVTYHCRENYILEGDATITCNNGKWEERNITCAAPTLER
ncbi:complement factor H isoform X6 [Trachinotus anak]|uniref:complement factor H isoform X6 n=1 Tax=Trachinotus anak TaxID=443729 RepID=UPI0039F26116